MKALEEEYARLVKRIWNISSQAPTAEERNANEKFRVAAFHYSRALRKHIGDERAAEIRKKLHP